jgi:hypothetical protein
MKKILCILIFFIPAFIYAQDTTSSEITGIENHTGVQIAEMAAIELGHKLTGFDRASLTIMTDWFEWTAIAIKNRARLRFDVKNDKITVSLIDHQYSSTEGWANSPTKFSKKNLEKYLGETVSKINKINDNPDDRKNAVYNSQLIPFFKPEIMSEGLTWRFMDGENKTDNKEYTQIHLSVTNTSNENLTIALGDVEFRESTVGNHGTMNGYSQTSFDRLTSGSDKVWQTLVNPGETKEVFIYAQSKSALPAVIPYFIFNFRINNRKIELVNNNLTIPFKNNF